MNIIVFPKSCVTRGRKLSQGIHPSTVRASWSGHVLFLLALPTCLLNQPQWLQPLEGQPSLLHGLFSWPQLIGAGMATWRGENPLGGPWARLPNRSWLGHRQSWGNPKFLLKTFIIGDLKKIQSSGVGPVAKWFKFYPLHFGGRGSSVRIDQERDTW